MEFQCICPLKEKKKAKLPPHSNLCLPSCGHPRRELRLDRRCPPLRLLLAGSRSAGARPSPPLRARCRRGLPSRAGRRFPPAASGRSCTCGGRRPRERRAPGRPRPEPWLCRTEVGVPRHRCGLGRTAEGRLQGCWGPAGRESCLEAEGVFIPIPRGGGRERAESRTPLCLSGWCAGFLGR